MNYITIKQLKEKDLCIERDNYLYDYYATEYLYSHMSNKIIVEMNTQISIDKYVEESKFLKVFTKKIINIDSIYIQDYIEEWYYNNAIGYDDDLYISDKAKTLLEKLTKEIHNHNKYYTNDTFIGYIDLSNEFKKYIDKYL